MRTITLISILLTGICGACSIEPPEGQLECTDHAECPQDWFCDTDELCYPSDDPAEDDQPETNTETDDA